MTRGPYTKMTPDQQQRFAELYAGGVRFEDIAAEFRVALSTVRKMCRRLGLPERKRPPMRRKRTMPATDAVPLPVPPSMPAHPFWSPDLDLAVMATLGGYPALAALADQMGKPMSAVQQRWHQLRAGSCAMRAARRDAGAVLASPASEGRQICDHDLRPDLAVCLRAVAGPGRGPQFCGQGAAGRATGACHRNGQYASGP